MIDSLYVLEMGMRHFFIRAEVSKARKQFDADYKEAAALAALVAPYRHARLSAVAGDPTNPARMIKDDATADELREEIVHHLGVLVDGGVLDLGELLAPKRAN